MQPKSSPIILTGSFRAAAVTIDAHTVAAPPISALIASIEGDGLREIPPLPAQQRDDTSGETNELNVRNFMCSAAGSDIFLTTMGVSFSVCILLWFTCQM